MSQQIKAEDNGRMIDKGALERTTTKKTFVVLQPPEVKFWLGRIANVYFTYCSSIAIATCARRKRMKKQEPQGHKTFPMAFLPLS